VVAQKKSVLDKSTNTYTTDMPAFELIAASYVRTANGPGGYELTVNVFADPTLAGSLVVGGLMIRSCDS
jgi:hypothetical protein